MGIYPDEKFWSVFNRRSRTWKGMFKKADDPAAQICFEEWSEPGLKRFKVYELICVFEERTDCYCCSCGDGGHDAACRNHGWAGRRPCELHNMPGEKYGDEYCTGACNSGHAEGCPFGTMPSPVHPKTEGQVGSGEAIIGL